MFAGETTRTWRLGILPAGVSPCPWRRDISHLGVETGPEKVTPDACSRAIASSRGLTWVSLTRVQLVTFSTSLSRVVRRGRSRWGRAKHGCKRVRPLSTSRPPTCRMGRSLSDGCSATVQTGGTRVQPLVPPTGGQTLETGTPCVHECKEGVSLSRGRLAHVHARCPRVGGCFARLQRGPPGFKPGFGGVRRGGRWCLWRLRRRRRSALVAPGQSRDSAVSSRRVPLPHPPRRDARISTTRSRSPSPPSRKGSASSKARYERRPSRRQFRPLQTSSVTPAEPTGNEPSFCRRGSIVLSDRCS